MWDPQQHIIPIDDPFFYEFDSIELMPRHLGEMAQRWKSGSISMVKRVEGNLSPTFSKKPLFLRMAVDLKRPKYACMPILSYFSTFTVVIDQ